MQLWYGPYFWAVDSLVAKTHTVPGLNAAGMPMTLTTTMNVAGDLLAPSGTTTPQQDLTVMQLAMQTALSIPYLDLIFRADTGSATATVLKNAGSLSGVRLTDGPHFEGGRAEGEYAVRRQFNFSMAVTYLYPTRLTKLMSFMETVAFSGGLPIKAMCRNINKPPIRQIIWPFTEFVAVQSGEAVGQLGWPFGSPSKGPAYGFPAAFLKEAPQVTPSGPDRVGPTGWQNYKVRWSYTFENATPLIGAPTLWNF